MNSSKTGSLRRRLLLAVMVLALAAMAALALWALPRLSPTPTIAPPARTLAPTFTPTPSPSPAPTTTPTPTVEHPTITALGAQADDSAGAIVFHLEAQMPPDRQAAEVLLWYDTQAGRQVRRIGPQPAHVQVVYRLDAREEGLARAVTTTSELDYWWLVRDTAGESVRAGGTVQLGPALQRLITLATPEPQVDFTWIVSDTRHFQFYYAPDSAAERDRYQLGVLAEAGFQQVRGALGLDFDGQMKIYLVPRVFWQGAATYGDKVQLVSYLDRNYTGVETWSYFTHEGTHALAQDLIQPKDEGGPDGVLVEGLAVWASGGHYGHEPVDAWAAVVAESDGYLPLAGLRAGPFYDFQHETSYLEAGSFVGFLVDSYGLDTLKDLYGRATGKAEPDEALVRSLYGKGYAELEADWLNYLDGLSPTPEEAQTWRLQVRSFDLMRRYETALDPDARILPDKTPPEWTSDTLRIFLHTVNAPVNLVLETALIAVQERIRAGDLAGAAALLDDVEASLDAGGALDRPSLAARRAIVDLVEAQDRAVLRADDEAYRATLDAAYPLPPGWQQMLQTPFTMYDQELVRLDVSYDGQSARGVVRIHAAVAGAAWGENNRLFAVTFLLREGRWLMAGREETTSLLTCSPSSALAACPPVP